MDWAAMRISGLAQAMGGRLLGLFASTRRMERVGLAVQARLEPLGIEVHAADARPRALAGGAAGARRGHGAAGHQELLAGRGHPRARRGVRLHRQAAAGASEPAAGGLARGGADARRQRLPGLRPVPAAPRAAAAAPGRGAADPLALRPGRGGDRRPRQPELPRASCSTRSRATGWRRCPGPRPGCASTRRCGRWASPSTPLSRDSPTNPLRARNRDARRESPPSSPARAAWHQAPRHR